MRKYQALAGIVMAGAIAASASAEAGQLRAGAAKVDITPEATMFPFTGGQAYRNAHDPIHARALVLAEGKEKVALIGVDATQLRRGDELLDAVTQALGIPRDHVILSATHDHNAPLAGFRDPEKPAEIAYFRRMKQGIVAAATEADAQLRPARIGFGTGRAYLNVNVDLTREKQANMSQGPSDRTVAVLSVTTPAGDPIAVYANYAVHANVMNASHTQDGQAQVTGDISGVSADYVEAQLGHDAVAVWTSGAAGDQVPLFGANGKFWSPASPQTYDEGPAGWAVLDVQARQLADEIVRVTHTIRDTTDHVDLWGAAASVTCPGQRPVDPDAAGDVKMVDADPVTIPLRLVMIGDVALAGVAGEVYTQIGEHLKAVSPFGHTVMVTNLPNAVGYLLTDEAYLLPSRKKVPNKLKPGCAEPAMIDALTGLMNRYIGERRTAG